MTRIFLNGCCGRMGRAISAMALESDDFEVVAGADIVNNNGFAYPVFESLDKCDVDFDAIIDFSNAKGVPAVIDAALSMNKPLVCCTTGLDEATLAKLQDASAKIAVFKSANMSLGINVLIGLVKQAAKTLYPGFDIEILEAHHRRKLDAPSGTAMMIADAINESCNNELEYVYERHSRMQARGDKEMGISAIRGGNIVGEHEVIFAGMDEVITFKHTATSKGVFGKGAVEAAKFLAGKPAGMYDMQDVIAAK